MKWTVEQTAQAQQLKAEGMTYSEIAERFDLTLWCVRAHLVRQRLDPEERRRRDREATARATARAQRLRGQAHLLCRDDDGTDPSTVARLLAEREIRELSPYRTYTPWFFHDPRLGYSALDERVMHREG